MSGEFRLLYEEIAQLVLVLEDACAVPLEEWAGFVGVVDVDEFGEALGVDHLAHDAGADALAWVVDDDKLAVFDDFVVAVYDLEA